MEAVSMAMMALIISGSCETLFKAGSDDGRVGVLGGVVGCATGNGRLVWIISIGAIINAGG